jgi:hypothetical protein
MIRRLMPRGDVRTRLLLAACLAAGVIGLPSRSSGQAPPSPVDSSRPSLRAAALNGSLKLDGVLDEEDWAAAPALDNLVVSDPTPAPLRATAPK